MKITEKRLSQELKRLYQDVPAPPNQLAPGKERMLAEAGRLATLESRRVIAPVWTQKHTRRPRMKLAFAYKLIAAFVAAVLATATAGGGVALAAWAVDDSFSTIIMRG